MTRASSRPRGGVYRGAGVELVEVSRRQVRRGRARSSPLERWPVARSRHGAGCTAVLARRVAGCRVRRGRARIAAAVEVEAWGRAAGRRTRSRAGARGLERHRPSGWRGPTRAARGGVYRGAGVERVEGEARGGLARGGGGRWRGVRAAAVEVFVVGAVAKSRHGAGVELVEGAARGGVPSAARAREDRGRGRGRGAEARGGA